MMALKSLTSDEQTGVIQTTYRVTHSTPGSSGTTVDAELHLTVTPKGSICHMVISDCDGANAQESVDKMAAWLRRLADGIEKRRDVLLPL